MTARDPTPPDGSSSSNGRPPEAEGDLPLDRTTLQVRGALAGQAASIEWVVERFGPALLAQARFRMPRVLSGLYSVDDVVQDVWISVLPRLGTIEVRDEGTTRVLLRYFSTTLVNRINELARRRARGERLERSRPSSSRLSRLIADTTSVRSRAQRNDAAENLHAALASLEPHDREVLVLRGIEQHSNAEVAQLLGQSPNTVSHRYNRALERLRERVPHSLFDDLAD